MACWLQQLFITPAAAHSVHTDHLAFEVMHGAALARHMMVAAADPRIRRRMTNIVLRRMTNIVLGRMTNIVLRRMTNIVLRWMTNIVLRQMTNIVIDVIFRAYRTILYLDVVTVELLIF